MVIRTEVEVDAPPEAVWAVLTRPQDWPRWTESMDAVEMLDGGLEPGSRVRISQPGMRPLVWTVSALDPGRTFTWTATAGGVTTTAWHTVAGGDGGRRARLELGLAQAGALAPVVALLLGRRMRRYVGLEAAGLRAAAEDRAPLDVDPPRRPVG